MLLNLSLTNHTCCLGPNAPAFLTNDVLHGAASTKQVLQNVTQYDAELPEAIGWIEQVRGNSSSVEEESQASGEMNNEKNDGTNDEAMNNAHTNNDICVGHDVKKFFIKWDGTVERLSKSMVLVVTYNIPSKLTTERRSIGAKMI